jgi:hypothetical protein
MALFRALEDISSGNTRAEDADGLRHSQRVRRPTWKVIQAQLSDGVPFTIKIPEEPTPQSQHVRLLVRPTHIQERNAFGLARAYKGIPSSVPDQPSAQSYIPEYSHPKQHYTARKTEEIIHPYPNLSSFLLDHYFWTAGTSKSRNDRDALQAVITHPDFKREDIEGVNFRRLEEELRGRSSHGDWEQQRGWRTSEISIGIPTGIKKTAAVKRDNAAREARMRNVLYTPSSTKADIDGFPLPIATFHYRPICEVIRETFSSDPAARSFHYHPYEQTYHSPTDPTLPIERVYDELYSSDAWIQEDAKIQTIKVDQSDPERDLPRSVAAIMVWSDETLLNTFSQNKAWPIYIFFGNQPKRERSAPTIGGGRHLAHLPEVSMFSSGS